MGYLESVPRRVVTLYLPLFVFVFVLLFPFYWMGTTSLKPNAELLSREGNPFWVANPTLEHFKHLLFETQYPEWMWNTVVVSRHVWKSLTSAPTDHHIVPGRLRSSLGCS
jgi:multiple sugar transport system permease protein